MTSALTFQALLDSSDAKALADGAIAQIEAASTKADEAKTAASAASASVTAMAQDVANAVQSAEDALTQANSLAGSVSAAEAAALAAAQDAQDAADNASTAVQASVAVGVRVTAVESSIQGITNVATQAATQAAAAELAASTAATAVGLVETSVQSLTTSLGQTNTLASDAATAAASAQTKATSVETALATTNTAITTLETSVSQAQQDVADAELAVQEAVQSIAGVGNFKYDMHVDPTNGDDANIGTVAKPVKTIARALALVNNSGWRILLHAGTYAENINFSKLNATIEGVIGGGSLVNLTGDWVFSHATSSVRIAGVAFTNLTHSGVGGLYLGLNTAVRGMLQKTGAGYFEAKTADMQGLGIFVTGAGYFNAFNSKMLGLSVANASAIATVINSENLAVATCTQGVLQLISNIIFSASESAPAVSCSLGAMVLMSGNRMFTPTGASARISMLGSHDYSDDKFDVANSTLSGNNVGSPSLFSAIRSNGAINALGALSGASIAAPWAQAKSYAAGVWVDHNGVLSRSNGTIPAGTAFSVGTTGATWTQIIGGNAGVVVTVQASDSSFPQNPKAGDGLIVTSDGTAAGVFYKYWIYSGEVWVNMIGISAVSKLIVDNTISSVYSMAIAGRYVLPSSGLDSMLLGREGWYLDWDGRLLSLTEPSSGDRVLINSGPNAGQVWVYTSGVWSKFDSTKMELSVWDLTSAYTAEKSVVIKSDMLYVPNANIPADTAFSVGTSGQTWRLIGAVPTTGPTKVHGSIDWSSNGSTPNSAPSATVNYIDLVDDGSGWCEVTGQYIASNLFGTTDGSGTYFISLPSGYAFDTNYHPINTQLSNLSGSQELRTLISGSHVRMINLSGSYGEGFVVPHSATKFKVMTGWYGYNAVSFAFVRSDYFQMTTLSSFQFSFRFKKA